MSPSRKGGTESPSPSSSFADARQLKVFRSGSQVLLECLAVVDDGDHIVYITRRQLPVSEVLLLVGHCLLAVPEQTNIGRVSVLSPVPVLLLFDLQGDDEIRTSTVMFSVNPVCRMLF